MQEFLFYFIFVPDRLDEKHSSSGTFCVAFFFFFACGFLHLDPHTTPAQGRAHKHDANSVAVKAAHDTRQTRSPAFQFIKSKGTTAYGRNV